MAEVSGSEVGTPTIGDTHLSLSDVTRLMDPAVSIRVSDTSWAAVDASEQMVRRALAAGTTVYGVTTGFGALSDRSITADESRWLQANLLRSHASGTGQSLDDDIVRLMLALRAHALAQGYSGVRRRVIEQLVALRNAGVLPVVPAQGSVGASGDLAPLAHLALPLIGEGRVRFQGETMDAADGLRRAGIEPVSLEPKEALALVNGTQAMTATGGLAHVQARRVHDVGLGAGALTVIAQSGRASSFDDLLSRVRPHPGQRRVARVMRDLLAGWPSEPDTARPVQDRYSLRAIPQVYGGVLDTIDYTGRVIETEINSATDNPLLFPDSDRVINGANFHGHPVALAFDHLKTAVASAATFAERRVAGLVDPRQSGLPAFLTPNPGLNSGLMIPHYLMASLVSENRVLAHPASVDSLSTSADVEDYNSMGMLAARNLMTVVENTSRVVAVELICACQAIDLRKIDLTGIPARHVYHQVRERIPMLESDQFGVGDWIESIALAVRSGDFSLPLSLADGDDGREAI